METLYTRRNSHFDVNIICVPEYLCHPVGKLRLLANNIPFANCSNVVSFLPVIHVDSYLKWLSVECIEQPHDAAVGREEDVLPVRTSY